MRDYSKISPKFWLSGTGRKIKATGVNAQVGALYLMSSPHANMIGVYYLPISFMAHEIGITIEVSSGVIQGLSDVGFCTYDESFEYVWVHEMAFYQIGGQLKQNDKRIKCINSLYQNLPPLRFLPAFFKKYRNFYWLEELPNGSSCSRAPLTALQWDIEAPLELLRSQEQEQEQKHNQEHNQEQELASSQSQFEDFWSLYPIHKNKTKAFEIWQREKLDAKADFIIADVVQRKAFDGSWQDENFIPHAATYLNGARWEDEITPIKDDGNFEGGRPEKPGEIMWRSCVEGLEV